MTKQKAEKIDVRPDGWDRFERAVDVALKTPPMPKITKKKTTKPKAKTKKDIG